MEVSIDSLEARNRETIDRKLAFTEFLSLLIHDEVARRDNKKLSLRMRRADFRSQKTLEGFNFDRLPGLRRERQMCGFRDARRAQAFLSYFGPIRQHFALPIHQMNAAYHRAALQKRFATWHGWTVTAAVEEAI